MKAIFSLLICIFLSSHCFSQYNYLGTYTSDGTPQYFAPSDVVSNATLTLLRNALPEGYPVPTYNPQYISSGYDTDIKLTDSADIWVTFVDEGAGYKNVLGFYTYNLNSPLTTAPASSNITIIFPNVSKAGSGGSLVAGNKVWLGRFSPNTGIGFMLIADGWRNSAVSNGNWKVYSNPAFNPEANASLRYHNVLIADSTNQRIILGFEDIRRDYGSCDNDFNDALFYITANPYTAMQTDNYAPVESAFQVSSANQGGLESNGSLAEKIALRNFKRDKDNTARQAEKAYQRKRNNLQQRPEGNNGITGELPVYLPSSGMFGTETAYISTPEDLTNITNATQVFSNDYYDGEQRVSAALVTHTMEKVYSHTKNICDRLNGASIENIRTILLNGYKIINSTFKKPNGEVDYALSFSVKVMDGQYSLYSLWNIEQYPDGEYLNFQIWGRSMGQVCSIANTILQKLESEKTVVDNSSLTTVPDVYIKKGAYKNGKLELIISNRKKATSITLNGNIRTSETGYLKNINKTIALSGDTYQTIEVSTDGIFDIGFSIGAPNSPQVDALYLADGAWGTDYDKQLANDVLFAVKSDALSTSQDMLHIERSAEVQGKVKGNITLFRNAIAGNVPLDISEYGYLTFDVQSNKPVEVVLVQNNLTNWNERARYNIIATPESKKNNHTH
jgi:hypothetical protein